MPIKELTGNRRDWSLVRADINDNFSAINSVHVNEFGAVGDGVTDDSTALQNAFDYANTNQKGVVFGSDKIYVTSELILDAYGLIIEGNNATIQVTNDDAATSYGIRCQGSIGVGYSIDSDAIIGINRLYISDAEFLAAISIGDMLLIKSDKKFIDIPSETAKQGETMVISDIGVDYIDVEGKLNDTYTVVDSSKIYLTTYYSPAIRNLNIIGNKDKSADYWDIGIQFDFCKNPYIENVNSMWSKHAGIAFNCCYNPIGVNCKSSMNIKDGLGYGFWFLGATANPILNNCVSKNSRHTVSHGGTADGVPHNSLISNVIGHPYYSSTVFDAHASCGDVVWNNCIAIGRINTTDLADVKGEWVVTTPYVLGDIVSKDNVLFELGVATSTGDDPTTSTNWTYYINGQSGFSTRAANQTILNCKIKNCSIGINANGFTSDIDNFYVDGLLIEDVVWGIRIEDGTVLNNPHFDNIFIKNKYYKTANYMMSLDDVTINDGYFGRLIGNTINGVDINTMSGNINISELRASAIAIFNATDNPNLNLSIDNLEIDGINSGEYNIYTKDINTLNIQNIKVTDPSSQAVAILGDVDKINFGSVNINGGSTLDRFMLVSATFTVADLSINKAVVNNGSDIELIKNQGVVTKSFIGYLTGDVSEDYDAAFTLPATEYIGYLLKS